MYEIGDEVIYQGADKDAYKRRGTVMSIEEKDGKPQLTVALENGEEFTAPIDDWSRAFTNARACNSSNPTVANALNACKAKNADRLSKRFGNVNVLAYDDGGLGVRYVIDLGGFNEFSNAVSWDDAGKKCAAEARNMASLFEKRAELLKQAASWLEQNAK